MMRVKAAVTMESDYETVPKLSNGANRNVLKWHLT